jgi:hypothetical protein
MIDDEEAAPFPKILVSFFENPEDQKPDIKALARLLRGKEPLPEGSRRTRGDVGLKAYWRTGVQLAASAGLSRSVQEQGPACERDRPNYSQENRRSAQARHEYRGCCSTNRRRQQSR